MVIESVEIPQKEFTEQEFSQIEGNPEVREFNYENAVRDQLETIKSTPLESLQAQNDFALGELREHSPRHLDVVKNPDCAQPEKKGGSYAEVKETSDENHEVHHMPAKSASELPESDGPAIKMEKEDHRQTASCGNSKEAQEYRQRQKELIEQGKFREAFQMDVDDIREKFGDKYDDAIAEAEKHVKKLEEEGRV